MTSDSAASVTTEYIVRCSRWIRDLHGKKVWETVDLGAVNEKQARSFYNDIQKGSGALEKPQIMSRTVTDWVPVK